MYSVARNILLSVVDNDIDNLMSDNLELFMFFQVSKIQKSFIISCFEFGFIIWFARLIDCGEE